MSELPSHRTHFKEPVVESGADPYVIIHDDAFYYCHVINDAGIFIRKADTLDTIGKAEPVKIWEPPVDSIFEGSMWAPEVHNLDGKWYIYFAAGERDEHYSNQRMYVLEGEGDDPQTTSYELKGKITDTSDEWAIDGTILNMENDERYFVWSGRPTVENRSQNLYISKMQNPWTLEGERVAIASPVYDWEQRGGSINEGPQIVPKGDQRSIVYSASHSTGDYYCLGQVSLVGTDPLDPTHWVKRPTPVYESHGKLVAPGHASFILTPDENYGWMIFHTARKAGAGWDRQVRLAAFALESDLSLKFIEDTSILKLDKLIGLLNKMIKYRS
ncbi:MAG: oxidoreductase [Candidatus Saccharibacteria bacterium]|nr:oxidoreductase [Candidatus Saccharibacteria bacterium]MDB5180670.1 oxidoreductase [Candidatus Saccharibacteria bacterium]